MGYPLVSGNRPHVYCADFQALCKEMVFGGCALLSCQRTLQTVSFSGLPLDSEEPLGLPFDATETLTEALLVELYLRDVVYTCDKRSPAAPVVSDCSAFALDSHHPTNGTASMTLVE